MAHQKQQLFKVGRIENFLTESMIVICERTLLVCVDAKARVNPAAEASILGVINATSAVTPITALDSRLNRTDIHLWPIFHISIINACYHKKLIPPIAQ